MKRVSLLIFVAGLAGAAVAEDMKGKSTDDLLRILQSRGLLAKPYYNGVPDPAGRQYGTRARLTRAEMRARLSNINLPLVNDQRQLEDVSMDVAITYIQKMLRDNGVEFNISINQYLVAGGIGGGATTGGAAAGGAAAPAMGANGLPQINGNTGLPGGGGLPGGIGQPAVGVDGLPVGGGLPGMPGGGIGGTPAGGNTGAFDPRQVKLRGFTAEIKNISAMELLERVALGFDHVGGIQYNVEPELGGIIFTERSKNNIDPKTGAPLFTRMLLVNPGAFSQGLTGPAPTPGGINGGGMNGGGMGGMGGMNGMGGMGGMNGGGMGGMGGMNGMGGMGGMNGMGGMGGMNGMGGGMMGGGMPMFQFGQQRQPQYQYRAIQQR